MDGRAREAKMLSLPAYPKNQIPMFPIYLKASEAEGFAFFSKGSVLFFILTFSELFCLSRMRMI
jgi:hypothetical protein